jgi:hypothetical protein
VYKGQDTLLYVLETMDEDEHVSSYDSRIYLLAGCADEPLQPGKYITACLSMRRSMTFSSILHWRMFNR